jgi:hypothetical protein
MQLDILVEHIKKARARGQSWRKIGADIGTNPAMARLLGNGYIPGRKIREKLNLPPLCPVCNQIIRVKNVATSTSLLWVVQAANNLAALKVKANLPRLYNRKGKPAKPGE